MNKDLPIHHHSRTDVGVKRSHNQDAFGVGMAANATAWQQRGHLFVVADGMGAHAVGELASQLAVDTIRLSYSKAKGTALEEALRRAITEANSTIHNRGQQNKEFEGMGTTATALVLGPEGARVGHVGDSRCYRVRESSIEQLSYDHSYIWEYARRHKILPEDVKGVPKNIIIRSLGPEANVEVDVNGPYRVEEGDRFVLCTDGLSGQVSDREIWAIVNNLPLDEAAQFLVDMANYRGGIDNVTLILVQVGDPRNGAGNKRRPLSVRIRRTIRRIYRLLPLRHWLLGVGVVFCGMAAGMKYADVPGSLVVATPGVLAMLVALAWYAFLSLRRRMKLEPKPVPPPPVYRHQDFTLQASLVEKMAKNEAYLTEMAKEHDWKVDWDECSKRRAVGESHLAAGEIHDAFREYCRALGCLFKGMSQARNKQEVFDPHWQTDRV